jgi:hypothetical protein
MTSPDPFEGRLRGGPGLRSPALRDAAQTTTKEKKT